jgi:hypothetical protein
VLLQVKGVGHLGCFLLQLLLAAVLCQRGRVEAACLDAVAAGLLQPAAALAGEK